MKRSTRSSKKKRANKKNQTKSNFEWQIDISGENCEFIVLNYYYK